MTTARGFFFFVSKSLFKNYELLDQSPQPPTTTHEEQPHASDNEEGLSIVLIDGEAEEDYHHWHWQCNCHKTGLGSKTETATAKWNLFMFLSFIKSRHLSNTKPNPDFSCIKYTWYIGLEYVLASPKKVLSSFVLYSINFGRLKISDGFIFGPYFCPKFFASNVPVNKQTAVLCRVPGL